MDGTGRDLESTITKEFHLSRSHITRQVYLDTSVIDATLPAVVNILERQPSEHTIIEKSNIKPLSSPVSQIHSTSPTRTINHQCYHFDRALFPKIRVKFPHFQSHFPQHFPSFINLSVKAVRVRLYRVKAGTVVKA